MTKSIQYLSADSPRSIFPSIFRNQVYASTGSPYIRYKCPYSIKYSLRGAEYYRIHSKTVAVQSEHYLLVSQGTDVECLESNEISNKGISIFITEDLIADVFGTLKNRTEHLLDHAVDFLDQPIFFETTYPGDDSIGTFVTNLSPHLFDSQPIDIGRDFFYRLSEVLFHQHTDFKKQMEALKVVRASTRREVFRRLIEGRNYLLDARDRSCTLEEVAAHAALSPYHFHRQFKQAFGITPAKFQMQNRLKIAQTYLSDGENTVSAVAEKLGFSDIQDFSRVYRKTFGHAPSKIQLRNLKN